MTDDIDTEQFATPDGPLSRTTLSCPGCDETFTGETEDVAKAARWDHYRDEHASARLTTAGVVRRLREHDREVADD